MSGEFGLRNRRAQNLPKPLFLAFPALLESMPMRSPIRTQDSRQGLVRVHSIDLKTFDLAEGVQGSQKARFPLAYHGHLYQALIPLLTRQDPNLSNPNRHFSNFQFQNVYD
jgi:hypothetical protein